MNQKDAVFEVIKAMKPDQVEKPGVAVELTKEEKKAAQAKLFDGFRKGKIDYDGEMPSDDKLAVYVQGLVSNWLRKDKRLNGGGTYQPRNPRTPQRPTPAPGVAVGGVSAADLERLQALMPGLQAGDVEMVVIRRRPAQAAPSPAPDDNAAGTHE
jgi:hypothetical protein